MFRPFKALPFIIAAASISVCAHAAEPQIITGEPYGAYSMAATRVNYTGEKAQFSLDIPAEVILNIPGGEPQEADDGSTLWELFYAEDSSRYIQCGLHQSEGGYEAEISLWREMAADDKYMLEIFERSTLDGGEFYIVDIDLPGDVLTEAIIGVYPLDGGAWLNISFGGTHSSFDGYREEIYAMLESFSGAGEITQDTAPEEPEISEEADNSSPQTGIVFPAAAVFSAVGAAAAMACTSGNKSKRE